MAAVMFESVEAFNGMVARVSELLMRGEEVVIGTLRSVYVLSEIKDEPEILYRLKKMGSSADEDGQEKIGVGWAIIPENGFLHLFLMKNSEQAKCRTSAITSITEVT